MEKLSKHEIEFFVLSETFPKYVQQRMRLLPFFFLPSINIVTSKIHQSSSQSFLPHHHSNMTTQSEIDALKQELARRKSKKHQKTKNPKAKKQNDNEKEMNQVSFQDRMHVNRINVFR